MKTLHTTIALLAFILLVAYGCEHAGPLEAPLGGGGDTEVTLSEIQTGIFDAKCAIPSCHVSGSAAFGLVLSAGESYGNLVGVASGWEPGVLRVKAGDPDSSYVVWKVEGDPRIQGEQMPRGGVPKLTADEEAALRNWITNGAKDN